MKLLILGGTRFLGRHIVEAALTREHQVTLFNRGLSAPALFAHVETIPGDREHDLRPLQGRLWDAVIDTSGYVPGHVRDSAALLSDAVARYVFISTVSVYRDPSLPDQDETAPLATLEDETTETVTPATYGPLKVLCERAAEHAMPGRVLIIRPGLVVGPHDPTDRFTYWPHRVAQGGHFLAPAPPDRRLQFIDARDLAEWTLKMTERRVSGIFNAVSVNDGWTMGRLLAECRRAAGPAQAAVPIWAAESFLLTHAVAPWTDLPLWLPQDTTDEYRGMNSIDATRAVHAGLTFSPLAHTVRDTLAWDRTRPPAPLQTGLTPERERDLLRAWHQTQSRISPEKLSPT